MKALTRREPVISAMIDGFKSMVSASVQLGYNRPISHGDDPVDHRGIKDQRIVAGNEHGLSFVDEL
jgi:hypothetical protein